MAVLFRLIEVVYCMDNTGLFIRLPFRKDAEEIFRTYVTFLNCILEFGTFNIKIIHKLF